MDSHLIAGAYSQQFLVQKDDETLINSDRLDAIARAKKLSQETNRRRKLQAHKRKIQAKREEKRRHDILTRRREEQRLATEKYQRSHLPPSARQSFRFVQRRPDGAALDDALQLIRGVPHYNRYMSSLERVLSDTDENKNPLEASFNKPRPHSTRPGSGRLAHHLNSRERAELMNYSKQNMTASKTLFEQMLEQQQSLLLEQQQQSLKEFSHALNHHIDMEKAANNQSADSDAQDSEGNITHSNSCSSLDSLEDSNVSDPEYTRLSSPRHALTQLKQRPASAYHVTGDGQNVNQNKMVLAQHQQPELQLQQQRLKNMSLLNEQKVSSYPQNQNISTYATYKNTGSFTEISNAETRLISENVDYPNTGQQQSISYSVLTSNSDIQRNKATVVNGKGKFAVEQNSQIPLKQISTDSLEFSSSNNSMPILLKDVARECSIDNDSLKSDGTEGGNISNFNSKLNIAMNNAGISKQQHSDEHISAPKFAGLPSNSASNVSVQPETRITPPSVTDITTFTDFPGKESKLNVGSFQPQYTSIIGVTVWPGFNVRDQMPTSMDNTVTSVPAMTSLPASSILNTTAGTTAGTRVNTVTKLGTFDTIKNNDINKEFSNLGKLDLRNSHIYDYQNLGNIPQSSSQKQAEISFTKQINNNEVQIKVPSNPVIPKEIEDACVFPPGKQIKWQESIVQNFPSGGSYIPTYPFHQEQDAEVHSYMQQNSHYYHTQQLNDNVPDSSMVVPTVRRNLAPSRPPSPVVYEAANIVHQNKSVVKTGPQVNTFGENEVSTITSNKGHKNLTGEILKEYADDEVLVDEDSEEMRPLRGILKQAAVKTTPHSQETSAASKAYLRDSLELAHVQNNKKNKKKSVRFANLYIEEDGNESDDAEHNEKWSFAGSTGYKNTTKRPQSAKFASTTIPETSTRVQRSLSAGSLRQQPVASENIQIRNAQQISSSSTPVSTALNTNAAYSKIHGQRSNLPPSFVSPLNTTPINRPKAAAHIIMSTDIHKEASTGYDATNTEPSTIHKSELDTKIRSINNIFMSKVPVKVPTSKGSNAMVYNVAYAHNEENANINANTSGMHIATEDIINQTSREWQQQQNLDRYRNANSGSKLAPSSNSGATTASAIPSSSKVNYTQEGVPSFSNNTGKAVYDETGVRIDRTPTDEEITWLWDKVRSCLNREGGNKGHSFVNGNSDQGARQPPILSTKLIDGATLGFGTYKNGDSGGVGNVRPGVFNTRTVPASKIQSIVNPVVQQQGGYLRRYGLLKQRRASSASAIRNNNGSEGQKAGSLTYGRISSIQPHQSSSVTGQPQQRDIPTPMAHGYKPQDDVSESTAAFIMAERLAKQSLSDSHIQMAMDDAHRKQEAYNRSKMTEARNGHSALSLEERKLLESLDKLNEKLKEPKFNGTIHYHQFNQAQLPAFPGHKPIIDSKRHNLMSSATQQRSQSARTRQNIYQYR